MIQTDLNGEIVHLLPEKALYWPRTHTLFIADTHWGKSATFRASGVALPDADMNADLQRLSHALAKTGAEKLIILGDMLHARKGRYDDNVLHRVGAWRAQHPDLQMILVRGNHDRGAGDPPAEWHIRCVSGPTPGPNFVLCHEPKDPEHGYALAGHLHPAVRLTGKGRQSLKLPCFWFRGRVGVLPAFGSFIDNAIVRPTTGDRVFVVTDATVIGL